MITPHTMCLPDYSEDFKEFALTIMNEHHFPEPHDVNSALDLYMRLLKEVEISQSISFERVLPQFCNQHTSYCHTVIAQVQELEVLNCKIGFYSFMNFI